MRGQGCRALRRRPLHLHRQEPLRELSAHRLPRDCRRGRRPMVPETNGPAIGTRVVVDPFIGCGHCYPCRIGKRNCCANLTIVGVHREGGFADFVTAPVDNLNLGAGHADRFRGGVRRAGGDRRAGLPARHGDRATTPCWCSAPGRSGWRSSRSLARTAPRSTPPTSPRSASPPRPSSARRRSTAATGLLDRVLRAHRRRRHAGRHGGDRRRRRRWSRRSIWSPPAAASSSSGWSRRGRAITFPGLDFTRKEVTILGSRASVDCFPEALDAARLRQDPLPEDRQLASRSPRRLPSSTRLADNPMALHKAVFVPEAA